MARTTWALLAASALWLAACGGGNNDAEAQGGTETTTGGDTTGYGGTGTGYGTGDETMGDDVGAGEDDGVTGGGATGTTGTSGGSDGM